MPYHLDFSTMSLSDLKEKIERTDLIPSMMPLLDGLDGKIAALRKAGVTSLEDLEAALKGAKGPAVLAARAGVGEDYLVLLRRLIGGFRPKPARLSEYPGVGPGIVRALAEHDIVNGKQLYEAAIDARAVAKLAVRVGVDPKALGELRCLADLSRIQWVSPAFARALYAAGCASASRVASANAAELCGAIIRANADGRYYKGKVGLRDIGRLVALARELG